MTKEFIRLQSSDGSWEKFCKNWKDQCEKLKEDFSIYEIEPIGVVREIAEKNHKKAAAYALFDGSDYLAMCQVNHADLPGYPSKVL